VFIACPKIFKKLNGISVELGGISVNQQVKSIRILDIILKTGRKADKNAHPASEGVLCLISQFLFAQ